jgi:tetratricopeptide (TPR) repeat protein
MTYILGQKRAMYGGKKISMSNEKKEIRKLRINILACLCLLHLIFPTLIYGAGQNDVIEYYVEGKEAYQKGLYDEAISAFTKAIKLNPKLSDLYFARGSAYANKKQPDSAISDLTEAIKLNPLNEKVYTSRGAAYAMKGLTDQAYSDFNQALKLNPKDGLAYASRAVAYYQKGEYDKAWEDVKNARMNGFWVPQDFIKVLEKSSGRSEYEINKTP